MSWERPSDTIRSRPSPIGGGNAAVLKLNIPITRRILLGLITAWTLTILPSFPPDASASPPTGPILRVETGRHMAMIRRMAIDANNRILVTGSDDKTIRVWSLKTGKLIRTLRVPINAGVDGKIMAVALSPNGRIVAAGGWTGWDWDEQTSIYLLDVKTGKLERRIGNLPKLINHLTFSKDGRYLAASLSGGGGIRVFRAATGRQVGRDTRYGNASYWVDFNKAGQLVSTSYDGQIRLYSPQFKVIAKVQAKGGKLPYSAVFSPRGDRIAVGFSDAPVVEVYSTKELKLLYRPDAYGVEGGLHAVSWSRDGKFLFGGGKFAHGGRKLIRQWFNGGAPDRKGRGKHIDLPSSRKILLQILPLNRGGVIYLAADPGFGILGRNGRRIFSLKSDLPGFASNARPLEMTRDGRNVRLFLSQDLGTYEFSVSSLTFQKEQGDKKFKGPLTRSNQIRIDKGDHNSQARINGRTLKIPPLETVHAVAINPERDYAVLGTDYNILRVNRNGVEIWKESAPATVFGLNISNDGQYVVAALGDGTIRWYRFRDGEEKLALFILLPPDDLSKPVTAKASGSDVNWVLWNQEGYFVSSPGMEKHLGWQQNRGRGNAPKFFTGKRLIKRFKSPAKVKAELR